MLQRALRALFAYLAGVATFFFVFWVPCAFLPLGDALPLVAPILAFACAVGAGRYAWKRSARVPEGLGTWIAMGTLLVGGLGLVIGFFGPMVFAPGANQGPLLGLLITGPLGAVAGAVGGAVVWAVRRGRIGVEARRA